MHDKKYARTKSLGNTVQKCTVDLIAVYSDITTHLFYTLIHEVMPGATAEPKVSN